MKQINFGNQISKVADSKLLNKLRETIKQFLEHNGCYSADNYVLLDNVTIYLKFEYFSNWEYAKAIGLFFLLFTEHNEHAFLNFLDKGRIEILGKYSNDEVISNDGIKGLIEYIEKRKDVQIIYD